LEHLGSSQINDVKLQNLVRGFRKLPLELVSLETYNSTYTLEPLLEPLKEVTISRLLLKVVTQSRHDWGTESVYVYRYYFELTMLANLSKSAQAWAKSVVEF